MAEPNPSSPSEAVPGTPGIKEIRSDTGSEGFNYGAGPGHGPRPGIRKVSLRAEIDTSPPFGSVKEAVTRFGGHGPWVNPLYKFEHNYSDEEFDIKKVEEQTAELEKDLIVKELETLDVLEELTTTKRIVEELKRELQKEAMKCLTVPPQQGLNSDHDQYMNLPSSHNKEMNNKHYRNNVVMTNNKPEQNLMGNSSPCPSSSPDLILMELKRAKLNLGKTINDLGVIQNSVESLTKKMRREKAFIEKTRERLTSKFAGVLKVEEELESTTLEHSSKPDSSSEEDHCAVAKDEASRAMPAGDENAVNCMKKTAEMRWVAAKKMEEAAKAAEAVALAEINALNIGENPAEFLLSEPDKMSFNFRVQSPLSYRVQESPGWSKKRLALADAMLRIDEAHASKIAIMRKLKEATEEVKISKQAMEEALNRVDLANRKQLAAEEALSKWIHPEHDRKRRETTMSSYNSPRINVFNQGDHHHVDYRHADCARRSEVLVDHGNCDGVGSKPVLKTTVSMRDVLSKKQVASDHQDHYGIAIRERNSGHSETHKVALSDMLQALRDDLNFPPKAEKDHHINAGSDMNSHHHNHPKQFLTQRKKFGFIQISLPLSKPSKKKMQSL